MDLDAAPTYQWASNLLLAIVVQLLGQDNAHAQYSYVKHPKVLVEQGATVAVLPAKPLRAYVYCIIASPAKGETLAPSVVTMGDSASGVPMYFPDHRPQLWANSDEVWVYSDQVARSLAPSLSISERLGRTSSVAPSDKQNPM